MVLLRVFIVVVFAAILAIFTVAWILQVRKEARDREVAQRWLEKREREAAAALLRQCRAAVRYPEDR